MATVGTTLERPATAATRLTDRFCRRITYLRVSITDRCNLRCVYCMPGTGMVFKPRDELLRFEEIVSIARVARELGVRKLRVTGGEPLVRRDCVELVGMLASLGFDELCLTSNGLLFAERAAELKAAGLTRVNFSLDTLDPAKFRRITRGGELSKVLAAVDAAFEHGLAPRLNVVAMRGFNDDELPALAALARTRPLTVRFIELMPFASEDGPDCDTRDAQPLPLEEVRRILGVPEAALLRTPGGLPVVNTAGPAQNVRLPGWQGQLGFIASMHQHLCESCNRVRLTADGWLKPCLLGDERVNVRDAVRHGDDDAIRAAFAALMSLKPEHGLRDEGRGEAMSGIGG